MPSKVIPIFIFITIMVVIASLLLIILPALHSTVLTTAATQNSATTPTELQNTLGGISPLTVSAISVFAACSIGVIFVISKWV